MRIGIIDADLLGRKRHRFPNLACEKISAYWKEQGADVRLLFSYGKIPDYDRVFVSKVFTDTPVPADLGRYGNVEYGGTGFFFDKAPPLPEGIEHHMPDYHLYDGYVRWQMGQGRSRTEFKEYLDYSIGFTTRGCFRKCPFCVNQKYDRVCAHSALEEFHDPSRKKICLLDDNILGFPKWEEVFDSLISTGKKFRFKQGMDERLLTDHKCRKLFSANYDEAYTFAFDNIRDYELIEKKLKMIRRHTDTLAIRFYVLVGFEGTDAEDIRNAFRRIELLQRYGVLPYIMRYQGQDSAPWKKSRWSGLYVTMARWCNQIGAFKTHSFREYCEMSQRCDIRNPRFMGSAMRALKEFEEYDPEFSKKYFDTRYNRYLIGVA